MIIKYLLCYYYNDGRFLIKEAYNYFFRKEQVNFKNLY
jgi:hypothetical protein